MVVGSAGCFGRFWLKKAVFTGRGVCRSDRGSAEVVEAFEAQFAGIL
jgi:hypothetical protein